MFWVSSLTSVLCIHRCINNTVILKNCNQTDSLSPATTSLVPLVVGSCSLGNDHIFICGQSNIRGIRRDFRTVHDPLLVTDGFGSSNDSCGIPWLLWCNQGE